MSHAAHVHVTAVAIQHQDLHPYAVLILERLAERHNHDYHFSWPKIDTLVLETHIPKPRVVGIINALEARGLLVVDYGRIPTGRAAERDGRKQLGNLYYFPGLDPIPDAVHRRRVGGRPRKSVITGETQFPDDDGQEVGSVLGSVIAGQGRSVSGSVSGSVSAGEMDSRLEPASPEPALPEPAGKRRPEPDQSPMGDGVRGVVGGDAATPPAPVETALARSVIPTEPIGRGAREDDGQGMDVPDGTTGALRKTCPLCHQSVGVIAGKGHEPGCQLYRVPASHAVFGMDPETILKFIPPDRGRPVGTAG